MTFLEFCTAAARNPMLLITASLTLGVIWVNGWTDAPNAIATAVSTGALRERSAVILAAVCNLAGVAVVTALCPTVAGTIYGMADFGSDPSRALAALGAAMFSILLWSTGCWAFGIPTSESHGLIAGVTGAAAALNGGFGGIHPRPWGLAAWGLLFSIAAGFAAGYLATLAVEKLWGKKERPLYRRAQILGAAAMAFFHGAQDGQKFLALLLLGFTLSNGIEDSALFAPAWMIFLCALLMGLGTACGGGRIIRTVGFQMVHLEGGQGFGADLAGVLCLFSATVCGVPVSTTHVKATAMMGAGAAHSFGQVDKATAKELFLAWALTFPACFLISFLAAKAALILF